MDCSKMSASETRKNSKYVLIRTKHGSKVPIKTKEKTKTFQLSKLVIFENLTQSSVETVTISGWI